MKPQVGRWQADTGAASVRARVARAVRLRWRSRAWLTIARMIVLLSVIATCLPVQAVPASAASTIIISEVAPWSSSTAFGADWFELTNTGSSAVNIMGWLMDDNSRNVGGTPANTAVALSGITSIGPGESVIFIETSSPAAAAAAATAFRTLWFGSAPPASLQIGSYTGSGVGLGGSNDEVNIYDGGGVLQANVGWGAGPSGSPLFSFDNHAGINGTISLLSVNGTTGAAATSDANQIGSPGTIGTPLQTPPLSVKINEVESNGGSPADWVEIVNTGSSAADLSGLKLRDSDTSHLMYSIPSGTMLAPGALLVIEQAQFGFDLDNVDSVTLFAANGTTVVDSFAWTQHAATTFGRCPDPSGSLTNTLAPSKGAANVCLSSVTSETWPGGASVAVADEANLFGGNMSGLFYQASGTNAPGVLWAVKNGPGTLYRLIWDAANHRWMPDPNGWAAGKSLRYTDGSPDPDSEGVTMTDAGPAGGVYVSTERNNNNSGVSRPTVLRYDVSGSGPALTATQEWNLTADLPVLGANLGLEAITWIPDSYLVARHFFDEGKGHAYAPSDYPTHGTGLFFVGVEANGLIYAYALNSNGTYARVATIVTGFSSGVMDLSFDRDRQDFWAVCDNTCGGLSELLTINQSTGRFGIAHLYQRPAGMPNINNEGFTTTPDFECVNGRKPAFWSDDDNDDGHALRAGTAPCTFTLPFPATGAFVIGDGDGAIGQAVTFWGSQWARENALSGGAAPNSFKGFASPTSSAPLTCGDTFTSSGGNSANPPATIPSTMAVVVTDRVTQTGGQLTGRVKKIALVSTDPGYGPDPGHDGTGHVVAIYCQVP